MKLSPFFYLVSQTAITDVNLVNIYCIRKHYHILHDQIYYASRGCLSLGKSKSICWLQYFIQLWKELKDCVGVGCGGRWYSRCKILILWTRWESQGPDNFGKPIPGWYTQAHFHEPLKQGRIWASSSDFENGDCSRPEVSVYIVHCYGSYNKNLLKVIKHSSLYVYYFSLLFVGRHGSFDVHYHHTWHFMQ